LGINEFFNAVLVSEQAGWRKPHAKIFEEALGRLGVAAEETVYVGDSPMEDIKGAEAVGMRTVFVPSQFYSLENLRESQQKPDVVLGDICELHMRFREILKSPSRSCRTRKFRSGC
jgi:putative hydrolase of the HAD superfamily